MERPRRPQGTRLRRARRVDQGTSPVQVAETGRQLSAPGVGGNHKRFAWAAFKDVGELELGPRTSDHHC